VRRLAGETAQLQSGRPPADPKSERLVELQKENAKLAYQLSHLQRVRVRALSYPHLTTAYTGLVDSLALHRAIVTEYGSFLPARTPTHPPARMSARLCPLWLGLARLPASPAVVLLVYLLARLRDCCVALPTRSLYACMVLRRMSKVRPRQLRLHLLPSTLSK